MRTGVLKLTAAAAWVVVAAVAGPGVAGETSARGVAQKVIMATRSQRVFELTLTNSRGSVDRLVQTRSDSLYTTASGRQLASVALQVGRRFARYVRVGDCFEEEQRSSVAPLSSKNGAMSLMPEAPGVRYAFTATGLRWSFPAGRSHGSVRYNVRFQTVSGTVQEPLGGHYPYHFTERYPTTIPAADFRAPRDLCRA